MISSVLVAGAVAVASEEGGHQLEVLGMPTYMFALFGFIFFGLLFFITISFSGRGIVRPDHAAHHLPDDEAQALHDYTSKRNS